MVGRKRAATDDSTVKRETRSSKVAKTEGARSTGKAAKGAARLKTSMAYSVFKSRAIPLYVNISTTAPVPEGQESEPIDPGFLANIALVPSALSTGSFGWKGHKRMAVELPKAEGVGEGEGEGAGDKVHVTLTINATVIGSKDVKEGEEHEGETEGAAEHHAAEETSGEGVESKQATEVKEGEDNPPTGEEQAEESASS